MKKILALVLALTLCLGLLVVPAAATGAEITWLAGEYDQIDDFSHGLAVVRKDGKYGMINTAGQLVVPVEYSSIRPFFEGLAKVEKDGKVGYIDPSGTLVIPFKYDYGGDFTYGKVGVQNRGGSIFSIDRAGNKVDYGKYGYDRMYDSTGALLKVEKDGKYGYINRAGKVVIPVEFAYVSAFSPEGMAWGRKDNDSRLFFFNESGQTFAVPMADGYGYSGRNYFSCGLVKVYGNDGEIGYANQNGEVAFSLKCDEAEDFSGGFAWVKVDGKWGAVNTEGKMVVAAEWDAHSPFVCGMARVERDGKRGVIDASGKLVVPVEYDSFDLRTLPGDVIMAWKDGKRGLLDLTGKEIVPMEYSYISAPYHGICIVRKDKDYGAIDTTGKELLPMEYRFEGMSERLVATYKNGKGGYIDEKGNIVVPFEYDSVGTFSEGIAIVKKGSTWGLMKNPLDTQIAQPSPQTVNVDGKPVPFEMYALEGGATNYIRVRDLAALLNGTAAQFDVGWNELDGLVTLDAKTSYFGDTNKAPFSSALPCKYYETYTLVNGEKLSLEAIQITYNGGGYTYYKLRDLGKALGFNVGWSAEKGVYVETGKPYDPNN